MLTRDEREKKDSSQVQSWLHRQYKPGLKYVSDAGY